MTEWHLSPEYILDNWTEAKLLLMFIKRRERLEAINEEIAKPKAPKPISLPEEEFMAQTGAGVYIHRSKTGTA